MSRKNRTPIPRRRRIALGLGTAAGASLAATFLSMGTAAAVVGETPADPFSDLGIANGSTLDSALTSVLPSFANTLDGFVDNALANPTTDANAFADLLGPSGAALDTANPALSALLDPFADALTSGATTGDADAFADMFGTSSGAALDTALPGLSSALDPAADAISASDATPFADLLGTNTIATALDSLVDGIPLGGGVTLGSALDPLVDAFVAASIQM